MDLHEINESLARQIEARCPAAVLTMDEALWLVEQVFRQRGQIRAYQNGPTIYAALRAERDEALGVLAAVYSATNRTKLPADVYERMAKLVGPT